MKIERIRSELETNLSRSPTVGEIANRLGAGEEDIERLAVRLRFEADLTQQEIGDHMGISQMQVSRILRSCIDRLRLYSEQQQRRSDLPD
jgi:DNA-directed RNA polymerase specialized sigma subunit